MQDEMKLLARLAMIQSDRNDALKALKRLWTQPGWQTLLGIVQSAREGPPHPLPFSSSPKALTTDRWLIHVNLLRTQLKQQKRSRGRTTSSRWTPMGSPTSRPTTTTRSTAEEAGA
jgi:hypothetical protein